MKAGPHRSAEAKRRFSLIQARFKAEFQARLPAQSAERETAGGQYGDVGRRWVQGTLILAKTTQARTEFTSMGCSITPTPEAVTADSEHCGNRQQQKAGGFWSGGKVSRGE